MENDFTDNSKRSRMKETEDIQVQILGDKQ